MKNKRIVFPSEYHCRQNCRQKSFWREGKKDIAAAKKEVRAMSKKGENIYKRKDGRWEARYIRSYGAEGTARYGYCYGKTYQEAKEKVTRARAAMIFQIPTEETGRKKRFALYCDEWLLLKRSQVKESTYMKYETILNKHMKLALGGYAVDALTEIKVEEFSFSLLHKEKLSPKTVKDILSVLRAVLNYTLKQNPSLRSIEVIYPKTEKKEMRVLSWEEQKHFTEYLFEEMDACKFGVLLALLTGLRIGEICALRWADISEQKKVIYVRQTMQRLQDKNNTEGRKTKILISYPKSNKSARIIPLNEETAQLCEQWRKPDPDAYILTGRANRYMEPRTLQYRMERYTRECGLTGVHFHTLRHSFATRCVEVGFEIKSLSEILGHSSPKITLERYVHSSLELKRKNMEKLPVRY